MTHVPRVTYRVILAGAAVWCAAIVLAPLLTVFTGAAALPSRALYEFFRPICHQIDGRSFHLLGAPLAVCSRCSAIYFAFFGGTLLYPLTRSVHRPEIPGRAVLALVLAPMLLDVLFALAGLYEDTNLLRLITGALFGFAMPWFIIPSAIEAVMEFRGHPPRSPSPTIQKGCIDA